MGIVTGLSLVYGVVVLIWLKPILVFIIVIINVIAIMHVKSSVISQQEHIDKTRPEQTYPLEFEEYMDCGQGTNNLISQ